jgi:hypothetical protein
VSVPPFEFEVPGKHVQLFAVRLQAGLFVYGEPKEGPRSKDPHYRLGVSFDVLRDMRCGALDSARCAVEHDLVPALCDGLAYWVSQTQDDAEAEINVFAFKLLERAKAEERKSIVDYIAEIA